MTATAQQVSEITPEVGMILEKVGNTMQWGGQDQGDIWGYIPCGDVVRVQDMNDHVVFLEHRSGRVDCIARVIFNWENFAALDFTQV